MFDDLLKRLATSEPGVELAALDEAIGSINKICEAAVQGLEVSEDPLFATERIVQLGSAVAAAIRRRFGRFENPKVAIYAALVLLEFGDLAMLNVLLSGAIADREVGELVARKLAEHNIREAVPQILEWMEKANLDSEVDLLKAVAYARALRKLGATPPAHALEKLQASGWWSGVVES